MNDKLLKELVKKYKYDFFLYPNNIFDLRIQEEMQRSEITDSNFIYLEFPYLIFEKLSENKHDEIENWHHFFDLIAKELRGFDVKGFLSNNRGIGIVFLDCPDGYNDILKERLLKGLKTRSPKFDSNKYTEFLTFISFNDFKNKI